MGASSPWHCLISLFFIRCEVSTSTSSIVRCGSLFTATFSVKVNYHFSFVSQSAAARQGERFQHRSQVSPPLARLLPDHAKGSSKEASFGSMWKEPRPPLYALICMCTAIHALHGRVYDGGAGGDGGGG